MLNRKKQSLRRCHNISDLRELARGRLPAPMFHYLDGAAEDEMTLRRNTAAFEDFELLPRFLVDVSEIDTATSVLGQSIEWPVVLAPTGMSRLFHHLGELAVARAAARAGTMYSLSTVSTYSIEDVAAVCQGPKLFQIYVFKDRDLSKELIARCRAAEYSALCLTIDVPVAGNRERDLRTGMIIPPKLTWMSMLDVALHVRWSYRYLTSPPFVLANVADRVPHAGNDVTTLIEYIGSQFDRTVTWDDAAWMIEQWGGPFAIKGVLSVHDAKRAVEAGATAVIVSNHGGRQLDGAPAPIDLIGEIVQAVGDRVEVICDGGVRRGTHVLKALAMGARACMVGRAYLYGLGAAGEEGVDKSLTILRSELERDMALLGCRSVAELDERFVRKRR